MADHLGALVLRNSNIRLTAFKHATVNTSLAPNSFRIYFAGSLVVPLGLVLLLVYRTILVLWHRTHYCILAGTMPTVISPW